MNELTTAILVVLAFGYMVYRQISRQPVTTRGLLLPAGLAIYLATRYQGPTDPAALAVLATAVIVGVVTGVASGAIVQVWQDPASGAVYRRGGWAFLGVLVALLVVRLGLRLALVHTGLALSTDFLNEVSIAMSIASFLGRAGIVYLRALALTGGDTTVLNRQATSGRLAHRLR